MGVTSRGCYMGVTWMLRGCYVGVTWMLRGCSVDVVWVCCLEVRLRAVTRGVLLRPVRSDDLNDGRPAARTQPRTGGAVEDGVGARHAAAQVPAAVEHRHRGRLQAAHARAAVGGVHGGGQPRGRAHFRPLSSEKGGLTNGIGGGGGKVDGGEVVQLWSDPLCPQPGPPSSRVCMAPLHGSAAAAP